jgi:hypothetical protein
MIAQNTVAQSAPGIRLAKVSRSVRASAGPGARSRTAWLAERSLAHDRGGGQPAADAVTGDDAGPSAGQRNHVVPVAADFERGNRRGVPGGESVRQFGGGQDGMLEGERDGAGLLVVPRLGQDLGQVAGQDREQVPYFSAGRPSGREFRGDGR